MNRSWKLETSTTATCQSPSTASASGVPMLHTATAEIPDSCSIRAQRLVTVVLPLVPVTATAGRSQRARHEYTISLQTGTPDSSVSTIGSDRSGKPGLATTRSTPSKSPESQAPDTLPAPTASRVPGSTAASSYTVTAWPC